MRDELNAVMGARAPDPIPDWLKHVRRKGRIGERGSTLGPGTVCISDLTFRFSEHLPVVLCNLNMKLIAGEMVSFVGPRGCGKTTLMQLIQGLHRPTRGVMLTCGRKDSKGRLHDARVAVVSREPMLFGGSILGNLMMADPLADSFRIMQACRRAGVHDLLMSLPAAYDTELAEGGAGLSPGQRQCISLARALLRDPDILIMDDSFDQCCPEWSMRLVGALNHLKGELTVLVTGRRVHPGLALDAVYHLGRPVPTKLVVIEGGAMSNDLSLRRKREPVIY